MSTSTKSKKKMCRYLSMKSIFRSYVCSGPVVVMLNWRWVSHTVVVVLAVLVPLSQSEIWADTPEIDSELELDQSFTEHASDRDYSQSVVKRPKRAIMPLKCNQVFIAQSSMFDNFIKQMNRTWQCKIKGCSGKLMLPGVRTVGLGRAMLLKFKYSGCENRPLVF